MPLTIYTYWAREIISGRKTFRKVPKDFAPRVKQLLQSQGYVLNKNGTVSKKPHSSKQRRNQQ